MIKFESYIPLKIVFFKSQELHDYAFYSKGTGSLIEFTIGMYSRIMMEITLLICKECLQVNKRLKIKKYEERDMLLDAGKVECSVFQIIFYSNGLKVLLSDNCVSKYVKMENVYFGLSDMGELVEVCVCGMNKAELEYTKYELSLDNGSKVVPRKKVNLLIAFLCGVCHKIICLCRK